MSLIVFSGGIFGFSGGNLLTKASETAAEIADGFNDLWNNTLSGDLYNSLCTVGVLFAVATFVFFMVEWTKQMVNSEEQRAVTDFIWVLIVVALLANNGQLLGQGTLAIRNYINNTNNFVLEHTAENANLSEAFRKALENEAARSAIGAEIENCQSSSLSPEDAITCLQDASNRLSTEYPSYFSGTGPLASTIQRLQTIVQAPIDAIDSGANPLQVIFSPFSAVIGNNIREQITYILLGLNGAYQWGIELTMLVTALIGPLAVGGSLLPYGAKSIFAWLTGYFTVGMAKLSFNIIVGFAAQLMVTSRADQPLFFLFVIAIIAPFLATGLAAGGGLAVLQQVNKAAEFYGSMAINFGSMAITKGAGLAAQKIKPGG